RRRGCGLSFPACRVRGAAFSPPAVTEWTDPGPDFGDALRTACLTTDGDSSRYALGCVRLDPGSGRVEATDSHCLFLARGFEVGFEKPFLLPAPHSLATAPLRGEAVRIAFLPGGKTAGLIVMKGGDWTIWTPEVRNARFPELDRVVPGGPGQATITLSEADAAFLLDRLPRLPGACDERRPITVAVNDGLLVVRASEQDSQPVELAAISSQAIGAAVCVADRRFLIRALAAGCMELALFGPDEPIRCRTPDGAGPGPDRTVVFATLTGDPAPATNAVRLTADPSAAVNMPGAPDTPDTRSISRDSSLTSSTQRTNPKMPRHPIAEQTNGHAANGADRQQESGVAPNHEALLERVSALGATLSEAAGEARSLTTDLRKLKKRNRAVSGALAGLKRLGSLVV
ncbi:MAG: hypothetical protein AAF907_13785, partial [Planctomycetota bacterium]